MARPPTRLDDKERERIIACYGRTQSLAAVAAELHRSIPVIKRVLADTGERRDEEEFPRIWWLGNDERFCAAMRAAVAAQLEQPPALCIFTDETPPPPGARIYPFVPPRRSYVGSSADWCADHGHDSHAGRSRA